MSPLAKKVLCLDSGAGSTVGLVVLLFHSWFVDFYGLSGEFILFIGAANLSYATYSGLLTLYAWKADELPRRPLLALAWANLAWVVPCAVIISLTWQSSTVFGVAHLGLEALFVTGLAIAEFRLLRAGGG